MTTPKKEVKNNIYDKLEKIATKLRLWLLLFGVPSATAVIGWVASMSYEAFGEGAVKHTVNVAIERQVTPVLDTLKKEIEELSESREKSEAIQKKILDFLEVMSTPEQKQKVAEREKWRSDWSKSGE